MLFGENRDKKILHEEMQTVWMVSHAYNPSGREKEAEEWPGPGQPGLPGESKSQNKA